MSVVAGPTQGAQRHADKVDRWKSRPRLSKFLRALILIAPIATSIGFTWFAGRFFPPEDLGIGKWTWVLLVFVLANVLLALLRLGTSRLLPLVALMKLTLVFPDHAPSRAKATLRKSSSRTLLRQMEEARLRGETTGAALHGDYLVQLLREVNDHDRLTRGHSERVRAYAELLGEELGLSEDDMSKLRWAALLHDVGKLSVPSEILNKDDRPTDEEWKVLSNHPAVGGTMLEPLRPWLGDWIHAADQHHCRWDGKGYPETLAGEDIAFAGRLVAIADAYDVMTSARSYKPPLGPELARQELTECAGTQFDPTMVRAFLQIGLNRLKTVAGPLAWFANLVGSTQVPVPAAGVITSGAVSAGLSSVGLAVASVSGFVPFIDNSPPVLAFEEPAVIVELEQRQLELDEIIVSATEGTPIRIVLTARGGEGELSFSVGNAASGEVQLTDDVSRTDTELVPDAGVGWENTVTYSPNEDFFGEDTFRFEVCDDVGSCETQQVRITVASSNSPPTAREDQASVDAGQTIFLDVLANDTDPDVDALDLRAVGPAGHGQARVVGTALRYTADDDYDGVDEFTYAVVDPEGASATGRVTITVNLPVAPTTTTLAPTTTTTAAPTTTTTTTTIAAPTTTAPTTTTLPVNAPPSVGNDATTIAEDLTILVDVLANDVDPETDPITIASVSTPSSGVATIEAGKIRYTPTPDYSGPDQFTYTISDGVNAAVVGTVNVVVTPVNDSPVITGSGQTVAESIAAGMPVFTVTASDVDPDTLTLSISAGDPGGLFTVDPTGLGTLVGTLDFETQQVHTLDITVFDGTVSRTVQISVIVSDVNEAPTAGDDVTATTEDIPIVVSLGVNDNDPDGDTLNWNLPATTTAGVPLTHVDGDVPYSPPLNFVGADSFTYTVSDPSGLVSNSATVSLVVFADNDAPVAVDDSGLAFAVAEDASITTGNVTSNDTDVDNPIDPTTTTVITDVTNGTLTNNNNGTFDYTPNLNHNGTDTFTYTITDAGALTSNTATVTLTITPNNDAPVAVDDSGAAFTVLEDNPFTTGNVTSNDTDVDNPIDPTTTTVITDVTNGTLTNNNNGTFDYTPNFNHNGTDTFTYTITDAGALTSNTATVTLTITPNNDPPSAQSDAYVTLQDTPIVEGVPGLLGNDSDYDGDPLTAVPGSGPSFGVLGLNPDGSFTYTPNLGYTGPDSFTYTAYDGTLSSPPATVNITVDSGVTALSWFFGESGVGPDDYDFVQVPPTPGLPDPDGDGDPGLTIKKGSGSESDADPLKFHNWILDPGASALQLNGPVTLKLWSTVASYQLGKDVDIWAWAYDCDAVTLGSCTPALLTYDHVHYSNWNGGVADFAYREMTLGSLTHSLLPGRVLKVRVMFGHEDVWVDMNATHPTELDLTLANTSPNAVDDAYPLSPPMLEDGPLVNLDVLANDTDDDLDPSSLSLEPLPIPAGTVVLKGDNTFDYTPAPNFVGVDTFAYQVCDLGSLCSRANVTVNITPVNDAPLVTNPGAQTGLSGEAFSLQIVATDVELDGLSYGATGLPTGLSIDVAGLISGTLGGATGGTYNVNVTVNDDGVPVRSTTVNFDIDVADYALSSLSGDLVITEILYLETTFPTEEFVEIYNNGATAIDITGFVLADSDVKNDGPQNTNYTIPATDHWGNTSLLQPGEHAVIWVSYDGVTLPPVNNPSTGLEFVVDNGGGSAFGNLGDSVWLLETPSLIIDYMAYDSGGGDTAPPASLGLWDGTDQGSLVVGGLGRSIALTPHGVDGNTASCWEETASGDAAARCPGAPVTVDTAASLLLHSAGESNNEAIYAVNVVISEFSNVGGATGSNDFVELYNPTATSIDIEGWQLEIANDTAIVQTILLTGPNTILPSGGHYLVDQLGTSDQTLVGMPAELAIRIADAGTPVDEVGTVERANIPALWPALWSEGTGVSPLVDLPNYEQSWERKLGYGAGNCIDTDDNASDFVRNLTAAHVNPQSSSDPAEPCGSLAAPTPPTHLVISEYRTDGPNGGGDELVEIFNPTSATINLAGYELQKSGGGSTEFNFPAVDLAPGQHYLTGGTGYLGPVDDTHGSFLNGDGVALFDGAAVVDELEIGTTPPDLPHIDGQIDQTYSRRFKGCQDTDVLIDDFVLQGNPTPTTWADPASPC